MLPLPPSTVDAELMDELMEDFPLHGIVQLGKLDNNPKPVPMVTATTHRIFEMFPLPRYH